MKRFIVTYADRPKMMQTDGTIVESPLQSCVIEGVLFSTGTFAWADTMEGSSGSGKWTNEGAAKDWLTRGKSLAMFMWIDDPDEFDDVDTPDVTGRKIDD